MEKLTRITRSIEDLACLAKDFLRELDELDKFDKLKLNKSDSTGSTRNVVVMLRGDLGAGKTAFVKECAKLLGVEDRVNSPTFVIMKKYNLGASREVGRRFVKLIHIDAYRLSEKGIDTNLQLIGLDKDLQEEGNIVMIEWPERVEFELKNLIKNVDNHESKISFVRIDIDHLEEGRRNFTVSSTDIK